MAYQGEINRVHKPMLYENMEHPDVVVFPGRLPPHEIAFVNMLIDDVDGIVVMRTEDPETGKMEYWVAPDLVDEFLKLFDAIKSHTGIDMTLGEPIEKSSELVQFYQSQKENEHALGPLSAISNQPTARSSGRSKPTPDNQFE